MIDPATGTFIGMFAAARHFDREEQLEEAYRSGQQGDMKPSAKPLSCLDVASATAGGIEYTSCLESSPEDLEDQFMER